MNEIHSDQAACLVAVRPDDRSNDKAVIKVPISFPDSASEISGWTVCRTRLPQVTREQVRLLRAAGILWIQPGIESLSTRSLRRMRKGVSAYQNVLLLKYAAEWQVGVLWNILYGFAGESASEFEEMATLAPLISHLQAPSIGCHRVRLDRFSPMHTHPELFGLTNVKPYPTYGYVFPLAQDSLSRLAYFFTYDYVDHTVPEAAVTALKAVIVSWQSAAGKAALIYVDRGDYLLVYDTRECAVDARHRFEGTDRRVFLACDTGATRESLQKDQTLGKTDWERSLGDLVSKKLIVELDGKLVNVAVKIPAEDSGSSSTGEADDDMLTSYLERMHMMRHHIERLKIRTTD